MSFDKCVKSYNHHHIQDIGLFFFCPKKFSCASLQSIPGPIPGHHLSDFCFYSFVFPRISYEWNHTVCSPLCLVYFT